jgi:hypothetical protein
MEQNVSVPIEKSTGVEINGIVTAIGINVVFFIGTYLLIWDGGWGVILFLPFYLVVVLLPINALLHLSFGPLNAQKSVRKIEMERGLRRGSRYYLLILLMLAVVYFGYYNVLLPIYSIIVGTIIDFLAQ